MQTRYLLNVVVLAMSKKLYIVRSTEDGVLAVCGNIKAAYRVANSYIQGSYGAPVDVLSYSQVVKAINSKEYWTEVNLRADGDYYRIGASIEGTNMVIK